MAATYEPRDAPGVPTPRLCHDTDLAHFALDVVVQWSATNTLEPAFTNQLVRAKYRFPDEPLEGDGMTQKLAMKTGGGHGKRYHGGLN